MRNYLYGAAQIITAPFFGDNGAVYLAGSNIGIRREFGIYKAFVIAEVEIGFSPVLGDENLAVLVGRHGSGIYIEIGVQLLYRDGHAPAFEQGAYGGYRNTFTD
jgi:hypothetical protein